MIDFTNKTLRNIAITLAALLGLFLLLLSLYFVKLIVHGQSFEQSPASITFDATGEAKAVPDIATFSFAAVSTGKDVNEAQNKMSAIANKAIDFVKSKGIDEKDIQTSGYSANPQYDYSNSNISPVPSSPVIIGYEVRENITVKVRDTSKAGDLLSGVGAAGISELSNLSFTVDDMDKLKQEATDDAITKAKAKAEKLSQSMGFRLTRLVGYYENPSDSDPSPYNGYDRALTASAAPVTPNIQVGENTVSVSISLTYEIK